MRVLFSIILTFAVLFSGLSSYAFGKKKDSVAPVPALNSVVNEENIKPVKEKKVKAKKEKTEKLANDKSLKSEKKAKKKVDKKSVSNEEVSLENSQGEVQTQEKVVKVKNKKKTTSKKEQVQTQNVPQMTDKQKREIEYVQNYYDSTVKNRSALAMYLNPNLDVREVRASHVLVKSRKDALQIRKDILNGTITFEEAAQMYSLCPSAQYGGDLGFFDRKKMAQQFADAAFDLKIGEISMPVGTKFGWHIIKTTDKR